MSDNRIGGVQEKKAPVAVGCLSESGTYIGPLSAVRRIF